MDVDVRLDVVERENEMLRERIAMLEAALGMSAPLPIQLGLTKSQAAVFGVLMARTFATKDTLMAAIYRDFGRDEAEPKIIDVFVCKIRKKVKQFGIQIVTRWGHGYELPEASKAIVRDMIQPQEEDAA